MTVIEVTRSLFDFFSKNDIFFLEKNFLEVSQITGEDKEIDKQIVAHALKGFEQQGLVVPLKEQGGQEVVAWVLSKPLIEYSQTLELNFSTITAIVKVINDFCDAHDLDKDRPNPLAITEGDIQNLILVYSNLKNSQEGLDS